MEIYQFIGDKSFLKWGLNVEIVVEGKSINSAIGEIARDNEWRYQYEGLIVLDLPTDFIEWLETEGKEQKILNDYIIHKGKLVFFICDLLKELEVMEYSNTSIQDIIENLLDFFQLHEAYHYYWEEKVKNELGTEINQYLDAKEMVIAEFGDFEERDKYILKGKFEEYCSLVDSIAEYINYESPIDTETDYLEEEWFQLAENLEGCYEEGFSDIATNIIHLLRELATTKKYKAFIETIENLQKDNGNLLETAIKYTLAEDKRIKGLAISIERLGLQRVVEIIKEQ